MIFKIIKGEIEVLQFSVATLFGIEENEESIKKHWIKDLEEEKLYCYCGDDVMEVVEQDSFCFSEYCTKIDGELFGLRCIN